MYKSNPDCWYEENETKSVDQPKCSDFLAVNGGLKRRWKITHPHFSKIKPTKINISARTLEKSPCRIHTKREVTHKLFSGKTHCWSVNSIKKLLTTWRKDDDLWSHVVTKYNYIAAHSHFLWQKIVSFLVINSVKNKKPDVLSVCL